MKRAEAYLRAVRLYPQIRQWCIDNKINSYDEMIERIDNEKPNEEWASLFAHSLSAHTYFIKWFGEKARLDYLTTVRKDARKEARGDVPNDRRPVPCICTDNGMEFNSFSSAGKWAGADGRKVSDCCYGLRDSVAGHHFALRNGQNTVNNGQKNETSL